METVEEFTLAVVRIEYANLYHLVQDLYSAFLMMEFFNVPQVLFADNRHSFCEMLTYFGASRRGK